MAAEKPRYFRKELDLDARARLDAEGEGLAALRATAIIRVPATIEAGVDEEAERAWLNLEWLELQPLDGPTAAKLGVQLAALHRLPQSRFGWATDNFIGASVQENGWSDDWLAFWRAKRLQPQLRLAAKNRLPSKMIDRGERLAADCEVFFRGLTVPRSLLHGDLWNGNAGRLGHDEPVIFDPAVYVGHREADLAMTELFGGFPRDLQDAYRNAWPLETGYEVRRTFYNVYHLLNHANLFGGDYVRQSQVDIERMLAEIR